MSEYQYFEFLAIDRPPASEETKEKGDILWKKKIERIITQASGGDEVLLQN